MPATSPPFLSYRDDVSPLVPQRTRRRGIVLSCAECRRLKLKCSRDFPCNNCVKKGCAAICPAGSLTTGRGNRFVLANTEVLHDKINELANRVRQLEDALEASHSLHSLEPHPLLTDDLLRIKRPLERDRADYVPVKEERAEGTDTIDALGSLSISQNGRANFFGQTANSWYLLKNEDGSSEEEESPDSESLMPSDAAWLQHAFPFATVVTSMAESQRLELLEALPPKSYGKALCDIYFRHAAWMYTPISENEFYGTVFEPIYQHDKALSNTTASHRLAVLYMVLALGTLLDLNRPPHSPDAMHYYQLGRAALALESVLEEQSISAVRALLLLCHFMFLSEMGPPRWVVMGIVVKLAMSIGLHRDSGRWNLSLEETQKRRELFYEIFTYDYWQCLTFGRPPSFSLIHVDCEFPFDVTEDEKGHPETTFRAWKHRFTAQCMTQVMDEAFSAKSPRYKIIQKLDKRVRNWYVPPILRTPSYEGVRNDKESDQPSLELTMQRFTTFAIKEMTLFYMHRGFFARALEDNPTDPMASKYAESVLAAYRGACTFVGVIEGLFNQHQALLERMWFFFTHLFSCAIVLGTIAAKPQLSVAPSAVVYLESAYNLFSRVSDSSRKAKILPILQNLREKAHSSQINIKHPHPPEGNGIKVDMDGIYALGGITRLVARKSTSPTSSQTGSISPVSQPASPHYSIRDASIFQSQRHPHTHPSVQSTWPTFNQSTLPDMDPFQSQYLATSPVQQDTHYSYGNMYQDAPPSTPLEVIPGFYGYPSSTSTLSTSMQMTPADNGMLSAPDVTTSWHNFIAQYK
ncbi:hypothetical protein AX15_004301 [Amanita polypyramis BW_CC]|nr:hypothetical protein AX15_004301 [Amanita polypyramis BW_CC]